MKVLQVIPNLHPAGAERFVCEIATSLNRKKNISCDILTLYNLTKKDVLYSTIKDEDIKVYSLNKKEGMSFKLFYDLYKFIKKGKYTVVHSHIGAIKYTLLSNLLLPKVKFVATIHSEAKHEAGNKIEEKIKRFIFKKNKCIPITISEESDKSFKDFYNKSAIMIPNGISDFKGEADKNIIKSDDEILFIHPASCRPIKNQKLLFSAFAKLKNKYSNIKLLWYGSDNNNQILFNELSTYFENGIEYKGIHTNIRSSMLIADAICLSSKMEGLPMTIIEAFSVGTPALCTPVGGCLNIIRDSFNGLLAESVSENDYYNMLEKFVLLSKEDKIQMRKNAYNTFSKYHIDNTTCKYIDVYRN